MDCPKRGVRYKNKFCMVPAGSKQCPCWLSVQKGEKMKQFMDRDFLLSTNMAKHLYHDYAAHQPIIDYHCHLSPQEIYEDIKFSNITQMWLAGDHYKWRQMRSNGVEEYYITGAASDREKFQKWAETLEMAIGNPLYHWSHLELQRYFGYEGHLNGETAEEVWQLCSQKLASGKVSARSLIQDSNVKLLCTTDDPVDSLEWHRLLKEDGFAVKVLPAWRPDKAIHLEKEGYLAYISRLEEVSGVKISRFADLKEALHRRMDFFAENGCVVSDHGLEYVMYAPASEEEIEAIFARRRQGESLTEQELAQYKTALMVALGREYADRGWVMQLHFGVIRDLNKKLFQALGADAGIDAINNYAPAKELAQFLNALAITDQLPKTILYSLNPVDNAVIGTIMGCFQNSDAVGKLQHGSAWWFNDHQSGMREQMTELANLGLLGNFVGMLTDSRSFLSYARHEYFRRILCDLVGSWVENGEYPADQSALRKIIEGICYENTKRYFGFEC